MLILGFAFRGLKETKDCTGEEHFMVAHSRQRHPKEATPASQTMLEEFLQKHQLPDLVL